MTSYQFLWAERLTWVINPQESTLGSHAIQGLTPVVTPEVVIPGGAQELQLPTSDVVDLLWPGRCFFAARFHRWNLGGVWKWCLYPLVN